MVLCRFILKSFGDSRFVSVMPGSLGFHTRLGKKTPAERGILEDAIGNIPITEMRKGITQGLENFALHLICNLSSIVATGTLRKR